MPPPKLSGTALIAKRLRETRECKCGSTKPATITQTIEGKTVGFCVWCMGRR